MAPSLGRPAFAEAGGRLEVRLAPIGWSATPSIRLVARTTPPHEHELTVTRGDAASLAQGQPLVVSVPANVPAATYDLVVRAAGASWSARHCVAIGPIGDTLRLAHLSSMNIGDLLAPTPDWRLVDEINAFHPVCIVATGDYLDVTHPNPEAGWADLIDFLAAFEAPALLACGDHDSLAAYAQHVAPSPAAAISIGRFRGMVLFDLPAQPLTRDDAQMAWIERNLQPDAENGGLFVVAHASTPSLLQTWRAGDLLANSVRATRVKLWLAGGRGDAATTLRQQAAAAGLALVHTPQSSTAMCAESTGVSHYRIIDLSPRGVTLVGGPTPLPTGSLRLTWHADNDGTQRQVACSVFNCRSTYVTGLAARVVLNNPERATPWCLGGRIDRIAHIGAQTVCRVRYRLPDRGMCRLVVGVDTPPAMPNLDVRFDVREPVQIGVPAPPMTIRLQNRGDQRATVQPLVRLGGEVLPYGILDQDATPRPAYTLRLPPGRSAQLAIDPARLTALPGAYELQVYFPRGPAVIAATTPLRVTR